MVFVIHCIFAPGALANAKQLRLQHYEFLRAVRETILEGGPMLGPDGMPTGMLIVVERESVEAARTFIAQEPYTAHGLFESVSIRRWSHVIPEPHVGFIDQEYAHEQQLRASLAL